MTEPTDAEILELASQYWHCLDETESATEIELVRAALAKWGQSAQAAEPVAWRSAVLDLIDDCPGLTMEQDHWLSRRVKELDFCSAPQPVAREPLTPEQMDAALGSAKKVKPGYVGWITDQRREWGRAVERAHGIKGGQQ